MLHFHIPLVYWDECIMSAVFLINRLPSHVLENKSPFQILLNKIPDYHSLRSFGCLCHKSASLKGRTKFDPREKACIFLGYRIGYKGYILLDLETNSISTSQHVIFRETILLLVLLFMMHEKLSFLVLHSLMTVYILYHHLPVKSRPLPLHHLM